ncbi:hypothetical protein BKA60DRAFT_260195 [Fusarium oxysporum]|nr:hypothetical protein BKA60DRAFT_260195 [Fusarium oxysporum]
MLAMLCHAVSQLLTCKSLGLYTCQSANQLKAGQWTANDFDRHFETSLQKRTEPCILRFDALVDPDYRGPSK